MRIAYLQGGTRVENQSALWVFSQALVSSGHRIAGMVERQEAENLHGKRDSALKDVTTDGGFCIFQDLGRASQSCSIDVSAIARACGLIETSITPEIELVILSKFGKIEAEGSGFRAAMSKALLLDIPVLTSVNPVFETEWQSFTGGEALRLPPDGTALIEWWDGVRPQTG